jgi:hypothetical protein
MVPLRLMASSLSTSASGVAVKGPGVVTTAELLMKKSKRPHFFTT